MQFSRVVLPPPLGPITVTKSLFLQAQAYVRERGNACFARLKIFEDLVESKQS